MWNSHSFSCNPQAYCTKVGRKDKTGLFEWIPCRSDEDGLIEYANDFTAPSGFFLTDNFSVIAVHGLHGDAHNTWQDGNQVWLRDFLPKQIPYLRVMSYGYNSAVLFSRSAADTEDFASELLSRLRGKRRTQQVYCRIVLDKPTRD
jgi:hypothetical protein